MASPNKKQSITSSRLRQRLKSILDAQFKNGKLVTIDIDVPSDRWRSLPDVIAEPNDPWIANMGIFQDDPTFDDFLAEVNAYRNAFAERLSSENRYHREPSQSIYFTLCVDPHTIHH